LELIASNRNPIESLSIQNEGGYHIGWRRFADLNLSSLQRLGLGEVEDEYTEKLLNFLLRSSPQVLKLNFREDHLASEFKFLAHKLLQQVEDIRVEFGESIHVYCI
jgi:hypothetical protein